MTPWNLRFPGAKRGLPAARAETRPESAKELAGFRASLGLALLSLPRPGRESRGTFKH